jgi:hypothetical protein
LDVDINLIKMTTTAMEFVPVGNLENSNDAADSNGLSFGKVDYYYNISKYETTYGQYAEFLNAVAKSDSNGLFNPGMQQDLLLNGITRTGVDGDYSYSVAPTTGSPLTQNTEGSENKPVTYVITWTPSVLRIGCTMARELEALKVAPI